ncbi:pyruvate carboxylase [Arthrobacter sp. Soil764]|uniref:pyruvate carboxylase n=1 Tax=Arthrobacter sp. Soil764 TaxID=1736403 RepID=UPI0006FEDF59|nr:pyruvate carboxylase [Arthrobacter sp. Soil764]KRE81453.1 pyruvate carboxylase [Arthrobacter sp. Soil764]
MFSKVLVANRGEIAIRAFRAAFELGARTVAVFPHEDRKSSHRMKADEAYEIGEQGHPVKAYLSVEAIIGAAKKSGADAIYPGYGFLAENPRLAAACKANGITFVGPATSVLELTGNKSSSVAAARAAGIPVLSSSSPSDTVDELLNQAQKMQFPLFVKAVAGGGGRGMRRVKDGSELQEAIISASREADAAFGDPTVFLEQAVIGARHIEVQILADNFGGVIHLYERDCSLQRRHQKVIELAPAPNLDQGLRERICNDAVTFAKHIGYSGAGTVEFLVDHRGKHVFIEMNPRIQVEHTVTEEITDIDIVQAQLRLAGGESLPDLGLTQDAVRIRGAAIQCRITTEDPANGFRPDSGRISTYRAPGGAGVRLDGGAALGAEIEAHFDSLLVKLTCRGKDFPTAIARARRAVAEFRIRGLATNIPFLRAVLDDPQFQAGTVTTSFIEEHPELLAKHVSADRGTRVLTYLADVTVNKPHGEYGGGLGPEHKLPAMDLTSPPPAGSRQKLLGLGPERFAASLREQKALGLTDTTFRDGHQSLLATRVRTKDLLTVAGHVARITPELLSIEAWGGATYDVSLRFLHEDPWDRLAAMREAIPNICLQMLLRGRNTVGYTPYPDKVAHAFVQEAAATGVDIFRIFDALNGVDQMRTAIDAVRSTGTSLAEVALCYTGNLIDPGEKLYTLDYYLNLAEEIVNAGAHALAIKDMAGLLRPAAAKKLVSALRANFDLPVHVHTHDTPGGQLATYLACWEAGADAVDGAAAPLAGTTSQPALSAIVAATADTERDTGMNLQAVCDLEPYWEAVRTLYAPFESGLSAPTGRVYRHEIPGGQLSNLRQQAIALGMRDRFEDIETKYAEADAMLGRPVKVTPSSKVVGDLALALVGAGVSADEFAEAPGKYDIPDSVVGFLNGELGDPPGGWPEPLRTKALIGRTNETKTGVVSDEENRLLSMVGDRRRSTLNRLLFPGPAAEFESHREQYGDTSSISTAEFLYGLRQGQECSVELDRGVSLLIGLEAISEPDERGVRTVVCQINGQLRPVEVFDKTLGIKAAVAEKADPLNSNHVSAPFTGVVTLKVAEGQEVTRGDIVATIEAMKMEASITAPTSGTVSRVAVGPVTRVEGSDLLIVLAEEPVSQPIQTERPV